MKKLILLTTVMILTAFSAPANAAFTNVYNPPGTEKNHVDILNHIYGSGFTPAWSSPGAFSYSNGSVTATRIDDYGKEELLHLVYGFPGSADDKTWTDGIATMAAKARFASYEQEFGYDLGLGDGYEKVFNVTGSGYDAVGSGSFDFPIGSTWNWVRDGDGGIWYSDPAENDDGLDHMITYQIGGLADGTTTWLVFWEDLEDPRNCSRSRCRCSDRDFNDLVVEIKAVIPAPGAILLSGLGVCLVGWLRRRRTL